VSSAIDLSLGERSGKGVGMMCFAVLRDVRTREREIRGQLTRRLAPSRVLAPLVPLVEAIPEFCQ